MCTWQIYKLMFHLLRKTRPPPESTWLLQEKDNQPQVYLILGGSDPFTLYTDQGLIEGSVDDGVWVGSVGLAYLKGYFFPTFVRKGHYYTACGSV